MSRGKNRSWEITRRFSNCARRFLIREFPAKRSGVHAYFAKGEADLPVNVQAKRATRAGMAAWAGCASPEASGRSDPRGSLVGYRQSALTWGIFFSPFVFFFSVLRPENGRTSQGSLSAVSKQESKQVITFGPFQRM